MAKITDLVKSGNPSLRQGTDLDRHLLYKATELMDSPTFHGQAMGTSGGSGGVAGGGVGTVNDVLATAGLDRQAVHDVVRNGIYSDRFMTGALTTNWADDGKAISDMFSWTGDAVNGPDARMAAETASAYGAYVGGHDQDLSHIGGNETFGQVNPEAARGLSYGLAPYIPDIAELSGGRHHGFGELDTSTDQSSGKLPIAKGIFSVLSTDQQASDHFNAAAGRDVIGEQSDYANDFTNGVDVSSDNAHLRDSMTLQGLVDSGIHNATDASGINDDMKNAAEYNSKKSAYELAFGILDNVLPGSGLAGQGLEESLIGQQPTGEWSQHDMENLDISRPEHQVLNALVQNGVEIKNPDDGLMAPAYADHPDGPYLRSYEQFSQWADKSGADGSSGAYNEAISRTMAATMDPTGTRGIGTQMATMTGRYNEVTDDADPQTHG